MPTQSFGETGLASADSLDLNPFDSSSSLDFRDPEWMDPFGPLTFDPDQSPDPIEEPVQDDQVIGEGPVAPIGEEQDGVLYLGCGDAEVLIVGIDPDNPTQGAATCLPAPGPGDEG